MKSLVLLATLVCPVLATAAERWVYVPSNYQVDAQADRVIELIKRAKAAHYTHFLITDSKFSRVPTLPEKYFKNIARVTAAAKNAGIELVPALFGVGYSNDLLSNDPNLAEGLPVKDALFIVKDYIASHVPDPLVLLKDGALQDRSAWTFFDESLVSQDGAVRSDPTEANARFSQKLKLQPFRQYHISVSIKSEGLRGGRPEIKIITKDGRQLNFTNLKVAATQGWVTHHITFNSLENTDVQLYFGVWGGHQGTLWWRGPALEECGLVNVLRRPGAVFTVRTEEGRELKEGVDYEPVRDPKLGTVPFGGEYEVWHEPPSIHVNDLPDGTQLRVSFCHPHMIYDEQVCACVSEPAFVSLLQRQAHDVAGLFPGSRSFMMSHDEWRVMNWCDACRSRGLTPGQIAADNVRSCTDFLNAAAPGARMLVWSDMFDPFHNARDRYYLVNGDLSGSWQGLDKRVIVVNWNADKAAGSLRFFGDRGHQQLIAGYYDGPLERTRKWLRTARDSKVHGVIGVMFTTWHQNYADLESFARMLEEEGY